MIEQEYAESSVGIVESCAGGVFQFSQDKTKLAGVYYSKDDTYILIYDITRNFYEEYEIAKLKHSDFIPSMAFSADGRWFASAGDKTIKIWDTSTWKCMQTLDLHHDEVYSVIFSQDSKKLISSSDGITIFWKLND